MHFLCYQTSHIPILHLFFSYKFTSLLSPSQPSKPAPPVSSSLSFSLLPMANREVLNQQLQQIVDNLKTQQILDDQFGIVHSLKESNSPFFLAEILPMFSHNAQIIMADLACALNQAEVDFHDMEEFCIKLKGCSSSIGARRMAIACVGLRRAAEDHNRHGCGLAMSEIRQEYRTLQTSLDSIVQLERRIVCHEP